MKQAVLSPRLLSAAEFVRRGAVFADIGTDHAYLPIFLLKKGQISRAICSDINCGPLLNAKNNARESGITEGIEFVLADGAEALKPYGATDIAICGMGGELIADIIERAEFFKDPAVRLILQPMSKQRDLRIYLASHGFKILREKYSKEAHKSYVTMLVAFVGEPCKISSLEAEIGYPPYDFSEDSARLAYINERVRALTKAKEGKNFGGESASLESELLDLIKNILKG